VISKHISNTWLWDRVRVSGGAYGGFCDFDTHSGTLIMTISYLICSLIAGKKTTESTGPAYIPYIPVF
jgi:Zn-dependent M16 (insulinase) family peptidase